MIPAPDDVMIPRDVRQCVLSFVDNVASAQAYFKVAVSGAPDACQRPFHEKGFSHTCVSPAENGRDMVFIYEPVYITPLPALLIHLYACRIGFVSLCGQLANSFLKLQ